MNEDTLNKTFHALADPSRRKMVELLREGGKLKVGDFAKVFAMSLNGVSKHLKVLEAAGLIKREVKWREHFIELNWQTLQEPYEWLHFYHHQWSKRIDSLVNYVNKEEQKNDK